MFLERCLSFIGPVPGVSSTVGLEHTLRAELSATGSLALWLDRQPLGSTMLPGLEMPGHVGLATYNMIDMGGQSGKFADVVVDGAVAEPLFDSKPQPARNWEITTGPKDTTGVSSTVTLPDKSLLTANDGTLLRSTNRGAAWAPAGPKEICG